MGRTDLLQHLDYVGAAEVDLTASGLLQQQAEEGRRGPLKMQVRSSKLQIWLDFDEW